jgi:hypothetical protein
MRHAPADMRSHTVWYRRPEDVPSGSSSARFSWWIMSVSMESDSSSVQPRLIYVIALGTEGSRRRERTHNAATIAVVTTHAAKPAAAMVHIPCMSYPPFGKRTTVAVTPAEMSPRIAQPTTATPQRSPRSMRWILVGHASRWSCRFQQAVLASVLDRGLTVSGLKRCLTRN